MIPCVKEYLLNLGEKPEDLLFIKFADRRIRAPAVGTITFLVKKIDRGEEKPLFILRIPRYPKSAEADQTLENEYRNLTLVRQRLQDPELLSAVPSPILLEKIETGRFLIIGLLSGRDLGYRLPGRDLIKAYVDNFLLAFGWKMKFEKRWGGVGAQSGEAIVVSEIELYKRTFPASAAKPEQFFSRITDKAQIIISSFF